jgi:hypothetical protein
MRDDSQQQIHVVLAIHLSDPAAEELVLAAQAAVGGGCLDQAQDRTIADDRHLLGPGARFDQPSTESLVAAQRVVSRMLGPPLKPAQHRHYGGIRMAISGSEKLGHEVALVGYDLRAQPSQ